MTRLEYMRRVLLRATVALAIGAPLELAINATLGGVAMWAFIGVFCLIAVAWVWTTPEERHAP